MSDPLFEDELQKLVLLAQMQPPQEPSTSYRSAFEPFAEVSRRFRRGGSSSLSMKKRVIEFMRKDWRTRMKAREPEKQRNAMHVMNERMRRERERQAFLDLRSVLPSGIRNEKISIIQTATVEIRKLEKKKEELQNANLRMEERGRRREKRTAKIRVGNPTAGIDSVQEVLKCLKDMGLSAKSIKLELSKKDPTAVIEIEIEMENEIEAAQVEDVVRTTLYEGHLACT